MPQTGHTKEDELFQEYMLDPDIGPLHRAYIKSALKLGLKTPEVMKMTASELRQFLIERQGQPVKQPKVQQSTLFKQKA